MCTAATLAEGFADLASEAELTFGQESASSSSQNKLSQHTLWRRREGSK